MDVRKQPRERFDRAVGTLWATACAPMTPASTTGRTGIAWTERGEAVEDISHASLNVDFAVRCVVEAVVFTRRDAERLANT